MRLFLMALALAIVCLVSAAHALAVTNTYVAPKITAPTANTTTSTTANAATSANASKTTTTPTTTIAPVNTILPVAQANTTGASTNTSATAAAQPQSTATATAKNYTAASTATVPTAAGTAASATAGGIANQTWAPSGNAPAPSTGAVISPTASSAPVITAAHSIATDAFTNVGVAPSARWAGTARGSVITIPGSKAVVTIEPPGAGKVVRGPVMPGAFDDYDNDSVMNLVDQCPSTPAGALVYDNGCRCRDSEAWWGKYEKGTIEWQEKVPDLMHSGGGKNKTGLGYSITNYFLDDSCTSIGSTSYANDVRCNPDYETGASDQPYTQLMFPCGFGCSGGTCRKIYACASESGGTCSDGIMNQGETGVDCGGKCAPCNTRCATGTKYAPADTPCTTNYNTDPYRVNYTWTDSDLEYECRWYEVCHRDLDFIIEEAQQCCGITTEEELGSLPDSNLCREAIELGGDSCRKCTGMYIIKGLGNYARWMKGYQELYDIYTDPKATAEQLINDYKTGVCRDYSLATATLLRKAGYSRDDIGNTCDGAHCYNVVRFPGDAKWHVVDTTGNSFDVKPGALPPSGYDYCKNLNESKWCFIVNKTHGASYSPGAYYTHTIPDVAAYWSTVGAGGTYTYERATSCSGTMVRDFAPMCGPGVACGKDSDRMPDFAPALKDIVGCG